ncbi:MAG: hypothetical protein ACREHG_06285 [Candidatus Saccharimonadales bacterium]
MGIMADSESGSLEHSIIWDTSLVSPDEMSLINITHNLISGYGPGPEDSRIADGIQALGDLERRKRMVDAVVASGKPAFRETVAYYDHPDSQLTKAITNEEFEKPAEVVPAIVKQYSADPPGSSFIERLLRQKVNKQVAYEQAMRLGLFHHLDLALFTSLRGLLEASRVKQNSPKARLEVEGGSREVAGRVTDLSKDRDGKVFLEVIPDDGSHPRNVNCVLIKSIKAGGPEPPPSPTQAA